MAEEQKPAGDKPAAEKSGAAKTAEGAPAAAAAPGAAAVERKGKKKTKKNVQTGIVYIQSTFNNTIITITDVSGNVISWSSAGARRVKGSRKSTPFAAPGDAGGPAAHAMAAPLKNLRRPDEGPGP